MCQKIEISENILNCSIENAIQLIFSNDNNNLAQVQVIVSGYDEQKKHSLFKGRLLSDSNYFCQVLSLLSHFFPLDRELFLPVNEKEKYKSLIHRGNG